MPPIPPRAVQAALPGMTAPTPPTPQGEDVPVPPVIDRARIPTQQLPLLRLPEFVHMSQYAGPANPDVPDGNNMNCGPVAALTAMRLAGIDAPGFNMERTQQAVDAVRYLATGDTDPTVPTNGFQLIDAVQRSGGRAEFAPNFDTALRAARAGIPVVAGGNATDRMWLGGLVQSPFAAPEHTGHWVTISGYVPATQQYIVNDPQIGVPLSASREQLEGFMTARGADGTRHLALSAIAVAAPPSSG